MSNRTTEDTSRPMGATKIADFIGARLNGDGTLTLSMAEVAKLMHMLGVKG